MSNSALVINANQSIIGNGALERIQDYFTPDYIVHLTNKVQRGGHDIVAQFTKTLRESFCDIQIDVDILLEGEDRVAWQRTFKAIHEKKYKGFPASGRQIVWRDMVTSQIRDGRIAKEWVITDLAEQLLQSKKERP